jgi:hypothetical protein
VIGDEMWSVVRCGIKRGVHAVSIGIWHKSSSVDGVV